MCIQIECAATLEIHVGICSAWNSQMSSHIPQGTKFGRYEILSQLGVGGMGEVYLAADAKLDRKVALKILPVKVAANHESMRRFVQEARAASALNHPNIVTIHEIEEINSTCFIATEFIDGETLRQHLSRTRLTINKILEVSIQIADALTSAHEAGIVHRDIKPENIMLRRRDGYVKVLDFGLAKLTEPADEVVDLDAATKARIVTEPGVVLGTVQYMSPEQARGLTVDARTDIFSFGVVLYEMLAGCAPFKGETKTDILAAILDKEPPPLAHHSSEVPEMLEWIVTKAIRKSRAERYQTARELLTDLRSLKQKLDFAAEQERSVPPGETAQAFSSRPVATETVEEVATATEKQADPVTSADYLVREFKRHKAGAILGLTALVVVIAGGLYGIKYLSRLLPTAKSSEPFSNFKLTRLTTTGKAGQAAISADGKYVVLVMGEPGQQSIWLRHIDTGSDKEIAPSIGTNYCCPLFTHNGGYIYYAKSATNASNVLYQVPVLGGATKTIIEDIDSRATLSPDGKQLAFIRGYLAEGLAALMVANADGSSQRRLATYEIVHFFPAGNTMYPSWSPDGEVIVMGLPAADDATGNSRQMFAVQVKSGSKTLLTSQRWSSLGQFEWLRDGSGLVFTASDQLPGSPQQIWYLSYPEGHPRRITNDLNDYRGISVTADSRALVTLQRDQTASIWIGPYSEPRDAAQITSNKYDGLDGTVFAPNGRVVYTSKAAGTPNLWITNPDGTDRKQLTTGSYSDVSPTVSPDGRYIVFGSDRAGTRNIWRMDIDGNNPKQLTSGIADQYPHCSPDSQWVLYTSNDSGRQTLWRVSINGGGSKRLTDYISVKAVISPDGKQIAFAYLDEERKSTEWVAAIASVEGGKPIKTFSVQTQRPGLFFHWSPNGRELTYIVTRAGVSNIWSQPIEGGPPKQLTDFTSNLIFFFDWSRDGKQLALARGSLTSDVVLIDEIK